MPKKLTNKHTCPYIDCDGSICETAKGKAVIASIRGANQDQRETLEDFKERVKEPGSDGNYVRQCKDGNPDCVCGEDWEKDIRHEKIGCHPVAGDYPADCCCDRDERIAFIKSLLSQQAKAVREECSKILFDHGLQLEQAKDFAATLSVLRAIQKEIISTNKES